MTSQKVRVSQAGSPQLGIRIALEKRQPIERSPQLLKSHEMTFQQPLLITL